MSYNLEGFRDHENQSSPTGREERTAYRRRLASPDPSGREQLLPANVFETPWDPVTPDAKTDSFPAIYPPRPSHDGQDTSAFTVERPLLAGTQHPSTPDFSSKGTRYEPSTSGTTINQQHYKDEYVFEEFGPVPGSANSRTEFLSPPPSRSKLRRSPTSWLPANHPWRPDTFEKPDWRPLIALTVIVLVTYPILWVAASIAKEKTLFWARFIVGCASSVLGFVIGLAMMRVGKRLLEAATWATLIHRSMDGSGGLTLGDLDAKSTYPNFTYLGVSLFIERNISRIFWRTRRPYDKKPWSLFILFFTFISVLAASTSFLLGRLVDISTASWLQDREYRQVTAIGDLSPQDIANSRQQQAATESFVQTWTLSNFGSRGQLPVKLEFEDEEIYFAELSNHLLPGGLGMGTFQQDSVAAGEGSNLTSSLGPSRRQVNEASHGSLVRYSRWGLRIQCSNLPNAAQNIVPTSLGNLTYAYVPRDTILTLMSGLGLQDIPFSWDRNATFLQNGDRVPAGIDMSTIGLVGAWYNNGVAQSFYTHTIDQGETGRGWAVVSVVMMRLNKTYTPNGSFPVYSVDGQIGYDSASANHERRWERGSINIALRFWKGFGLQGGWPGQHLNSTGKFIPFAAAYDNSRNLILKDNGRDFWWVPNPTAISWTDGYGPRNYTSLSPFHLEKGLGNADAAQLLPYLTGSQPIVAYQYTEDVLAYATVLPIPTVLTLLAILLLGFSSAFVVPRLPLNIPRRDFGLFTWIATFEGDGILKHAISHESLNRNMSLEEVQHKYAHQKVRYGA